MQNGIISLVAKGAKRMRRLRAGLLQPFIPLSISWVGKGELFTLKEIEMSGQMYNFAKIKLLCGFYLNELLLRLLPKGDPDSELFAYYEQALQNIASNNNVQWWLRLFEKKLLASIGYGLCLSVEQATGRPISENNMYFFSPEDGPVLIHDNSFAYHEDVVKISGAALLALEREQQPELDKQVLSELKMLLRYVLAKYLGNKPLQSRLLLLS